MVVPQMEFKTQLLESVIAMWVLLVWIALYLCASLRASTGIALMENVYAYVAIQGRLVRLLSAPIIVGSMESVKMGNAHAIQDILEVIVAMRLLLPQLKEIRRPS